MKDKKIKVFHGLVNYGTQAGVLSKELRKQGIGAISVINSDDFNRQVDIELLQGSNILYRILKRPVNFIKKLYYFITYNTFHFYYGTTLLSNQWDLPFYGFFGKKVVMEYLGYDVQLYQYSMDKYEITNVKFYKSKEVSLKADLIKKKRLNYESRFIDKQLVCAPYLSEFVLGSKVLPLAINLEHFKYVPRKPTNDEIVIMHAPTSQGNKGTIYIVDAINQLINEGFAIKLLLVENVSHDVLRKKYIECDIFIDQILAGWYGTASIEAMATGRPTVCFLRESYFEHINYGLEIPIINANPNNIYDILKKTLNNTELLPNIGLKSRHFIERTHNAETLAKKLVEIYKSL